MIEKKIEEYLKEVKWSGFGGSDDSYKKGVAELSDLLENAYKDAASMERIIEKLFHPKKDYLQAIFLYKLF